MGGTQKINKGIRQHLGFILAGPLNAKTYLHLPADSSPSKGLHMITHLSFHATAPDEPV